MEWGQQRRRGLMAAWPQIGVPIGLLLGTGAMTAIALSAQSAFKAWAWRIPFLASLLLVAIGRLFEKGLRVGTGQANVKRYNRQLRDMITEGRATPSFVVSHELPLEQAPAAYQKFDQRVEGYIKVILKPGAL
jgi:threonine dehydrogenase-like Zn-dependent dehydrogenase